MTAQNTMRLRLERHAEFLRARVRRSAPRALLAMESVEDLVQEVHTRVLDRPDAYVEHEGVPFEAWLGRVATRVVQDRRDYFRALKRDGAKVLRLAFSSSESAQELLKDVAASVTGPLTFAARREQLHLAARALDTLMERDRWLIEGVCSGRDLRTDAAELGVAEDSVSQARRRAMERLRRAFKIVAGGLDGSPSGHGGGG